MSLLHETVVDLATVQKVKDALVNPDVRFLKLWEQQSGDADGSHPLGQWSSVVTQDNPAVIYDDGAAFCSPVITFDKTGNALHFHDSLVAYTDHGWAQKKYFDGLEQYLRGSEVVCGIGGLNVDITEKGQDPQVRNPIDKVIDFVESQIKSKYASVDFLSLVSKQYDNQDRRSSVAPDNTTMRGFLFIPRYLARNDKNHLLGITDGEDNHLRFAFRIR